MRGRRESQTLDSVLDVKVFTGTDQEKTKLCRTCSQWKKISEFGNRKRKGCQDRPKSICSVCMATKAEKYRDSRKQVTVVIDNNLTKICTQCGEEKSLLFFANNFLGKFGKTSRCYSCCAINKAIYDDNNVEVLKQRRKINYDANSEKFIEESRIYRENNKERTIQSARNWQKKNPEKHRQIQRDCTRKRRETVIGGLNVRMGNYIRYCLKFTKGGKKWETLVGYTCGELKIHIENQFTEGMTWEKYLSGEIQLDHKIPLAAFTFESADDVEFKNAWSIKNLQPMWAADNIRKSNKILYPDLYKELTGR